MTGASMENHGLQSKQIRHSTNVQVDVKILKFLRNQGQLMFLIPFSSNNQTFFKVVGIICGVALMPLAYWLLTLRFPFFSNLPLTCLVMDIINYSVGYFYLASFCISENYYHSNWQNMEKIVSRTEQLLKSIRFAVTKENFIWKYGAVHVVYVIIHGAQLYRWAILGRTDLVLSYLGFRVTHYWTTFTAILIHQWLLFLSRRYNYLNKYVTHTFSQRVIIVEQVVEKLRTVGKIYQNLTAISQELNELFSMHLFFMFFLVVSITLHGLSFSILLLEDYVLGITAVIYVAMFFANMLLVVVSYEMLREKSGNVKKTCLFLQEEMVQGQLRNELGFLTKCMKKLNPKMSAIGFFEMDFQLISGYISMVFAYLIIILQFSNTYV